MSSKFLVELSNDYEKLFEIELGYDVIIYAGEEPNIKEIHAHSNILCVRSKYFRTAFSNECAEKKDGKFILRKPTISSYLFNIILRFIYCGNIELKNLQGPDVIKLLIAADELNIQSLISHIQEFLIEHQAEFLNQNPTDILETVYHHETFTDLWNFCLEKICEEPKILFYSDKFLNLKASLLEILLKRDDLYLSEIEIWENLLKWCFFQQNITNDPTKWEKEDITKIEKSLHRFIPLIRFYDINPADFFYRVYNYKDILPKDLIHDLLEFHIVPDMRPKINVAPSRKPKLLIESSHIPLFTSWIDKKDSSHYNKREIPYKYKLLYRSGRDGFNAESFHRNCDNKGATIWIAKILGSKQLIGGYNPLDWNGNGSKTTPDSFLFNFIDENNISTAKLGYVKDKINAIFCYKDQGPSMGNLHCFDSNNWKCSDGNRYPSIELGYDVIIYSGEEPNIKEIHAHSNILCVRSKYFRTAFSNEWAEKKDGKFILRKPNISPHLFNIILRFIYCGNIELKNLQGPDVLKLLISADELNMQSLISHIQEFLIEHQAEFLNRNPIDILETVYQNEMFTDLWNFCLEKICETPKILFNSDKFLNLKASLLELLLKRDDLDLSEIEIWENLLKWCFAQQNIINDPTKWEKEDITKIERSLHRFIPLIRFYDIKPADFFYKVYNYKDILPKDLIHDLLEFHIVPDLKPKTNVAPLRQPKFDSILTEPNHFPLFASWIDKKDSSYYNKEEIPYEFKLLYHSGQDGFNAASFHRNCDNKGATIWIAKILGSKQLIGGYNPLDWNGSGWKNTTDSFLFSFTDEKNISTAKLSYVNYKYARYAVSCNNNQGPSMGNLICPDSNDWQCCGTRYLNNNADIPNNFTIENYEIFQVIKK
ncbi:hypothetical protein C1645_809264 [Glomus cerebriforme]|uniref:BTB/POZ domain-containing protein n=1 Tax=Glomus cerebriforme TaxID=658196 RepID=A0A397SBI8_9GLOM|nr:hypothetical protein C1645_809264 [Glomus cerebriforme]